MRSLVLALVLLAAAPAAGHAATLGSALGTQPPFGEVCSPTACTVVQTAMPGGEPTVTQPSVITGWRLRTGEGSGAQQIRLRVLGRDGSRFTALRTGGSVAITAAAATVQRADRVAIGPGELLGIDLEASKLAIVRIPTPGAAASFFNPRLADGALSTLPDARAGWELALQADIEPDLDRDVRGDETLDNCVGVANPDQVDTDGDGLGDACDPDVDGDGTPNDEDPDLDGDGAPNGSDNCPAVGNPGQADGDGDGAGDVCDPDADGDGRANETDNCPSAANPGQEDMDLDGAGDACDPDVDGDGSGNPADADDDNDGVPDTADNCASSPNPGQADSDGDGPGDACDPDDDNDGAADGADICATTASPDQTDTDKDGKGNPCDGDDDADGRPDASDNCPLVANPGQVDSDRDGQGNECDASPTGGGSGPGQPPGQGGSGQQSGGGSGPGARTAAAATPQLRLRKAKVRMGSRRRVSVAVECRVASCLGTFRSRDTTGAKLALAPGKRKTLKLRLSAKAAKRVTRSHGKRLRVRFTFRTFAGRTSTLTMTVLGSRRR